MMKKLCACFLSAIILCAGAHAASFTDVTQESHPWAIREIEEMVKNKLLKGYSDGTFRPDMGVSKIEALVLTARVLGYTNTENEAFCQFADGMYEEYVSEYDAAYPSEVSYLLYKGVLSIQELKSYIGGDNANAAMKRHEVAVLLTKALGVVDTLDEVDADEMVFTDAISIPPSSRPYVDYVAGIELMKAMNVGTNINEFMPLNPVTRGQISVLLYRMQGIMDLNITVDTIKSVSFDDNDDVIMLADSNDGYSIRSSVSIMVDGYAAKISDVQAGAQIAIIQKNGVISAIETISPEISEEIEGTIESKASGTIRIKDMETKEVTGYTLASNLGVTVDGESSTLAKVKYNDWVFVKISGGKVIQIDAHTKESIVTGVVEAIEIDPEYVMSVKPTNGETEDYYAESSVSVRRNGNSATLRDVLQGDKVELRLTYGKISSVTATSKTYQTEGTLEELTIGKNSALKIKVSGDKIDSYAVLREVVISIDDVTAPTLYDLRIGANVKLSIDSDTVTKITASAPIESTFVTGKIKSVNSSYGFMTISEESADGSVRDSSVFFKKVGNTKIVDGKTGKDLEIRDLTVGMTVTVTGNVIQGGYEAVTVVVGAV